MMWGNQARGVFGSQSLPPIGAGNANNVLPGLPPLPGPVSGYGGGTFDLDGRQVTPVNTTVMDAPAPMQPAPAPQIQPRGLFGRRGGPLATNDPANPAPAASDAPQPLPVLGGSMRQPFDYEAVKAMLLPPGRKPSTIQTILEIAAPALMAAGGNQEGANAFLSQLQARRSEADRRRWETTKLLEGWRHQDWSRSNQADLSAAAPFTIGRNRLQFNPATGKVEPIYQGNADFEDYARALNLEPGSEEYFNAVEDYVLRGQGPTAFDRSKQIDDYRTGNRVKLEGLRQRNRVGLEGVRQGNRLTLKQTPGARTGGGENIPSVASPAEAMKLPKGSKFRTPDGQIRIVP